MGMLGVRGAEVDETAEVMRKMENGYGLEDRGIWIWKGYLGRG